MLLLSENCFWYRVYMYAKHRHRLWSWLRINLRQLSSTNLSLNSVEQTWHQFLLSTADQCCNFLVTISAISSVKSIPSSIRTKFKKDQAKTQHTSIGTQSRQPLNLIKQEQLMPSLTILWNIKTTSSLPGCLTRHCQRSLRKVFLSHHYWTVTSSTITSILMSGQVSTLMTTSTFVHTTSQSSTSETTMKQSSLRISSNTAKTKDQTLTAARCSRSSILWVSCQALENELNQVMGNTKKVRW